MEGYKARLRYMFAGRVSEEEINRLAELYGPGRYGRTDDPVEEKE